MSKVYLVLLPEHLEAKSIEEVDKVLAEKGVDVTFIQVGMPHGTVMEIAEFETNEGKRRE